MDQILHFTLFGGQARALILDTTELAKKAQQIHGLSSVAAAALGRTMTATLCLASTMKSENDSLSCSIKGDGPLGSVVCAADASCRVRGYVQNPECDVPDKMPGKLDVGAAVGKGKLIVVKDLGLKEPYIGQTELVSGEIAEDFAAYLTFSEQQPSLLALGVRLEHGLVTASGGVLLQPLPGCGEEALSAMEGTAPLLSDLSSLLQDAGSAEQLAEWALVCMPKERIKVNTPAWYCPCSRERYERILLTLGKAELTDMIEQQHGAELQCHFCNQKYYYTEEDLKALIANA